MPVIRGKLVLHAAMLLLARSCYGFALSGRAGSGLGFKRCLSALPAAKTVFAPRGVPRQACRPILRPVNMEKPVLGDPPRSNVGMDGGDMWIGSRLNLEEIAERVDEACSYSVGNPIIEQYYPSRKWLWRQWRGTVVRCTLPREVLFITALSALLCCFLDLTVGLCPTLVTNPAVCVCVCVCV